MNCLFELKRTEQLHDEFTSELVIWGTDRAIMGWATYLKLPLKDKTIPRWAACLNPFRMQACLNPEMLGFCSLFQKNIHWVSLHLSISKRKALFSGLPLLLLFFAASVSEAYKGSVGIPFVSRRREALELEREALGVFVLLARGAGEMVAVIWC
jgi:hypothetical protein